jgi:hydroxypyruvate reductase
LADLIETTRLLLASGVPIEAINAARKRLSVVAGGRLASAAFPARVVALVVSDVVGDDLAAIASGPTIGDTRANHPLAIRTHPVWMRLPASVRTALGDPTHAPIAPDDPRLARTSTHIIGSNRVALAAAKEKAKALGYAVEIASSTMAGEARDVGAAHAHALLNGPPRVLLWGGETTVTVTGNGRGGRDQEAALAAAIELSGSERAAVLLCGGTDGIDGPTEAAGGIATPQTVSRGSAQGLRAGDFLNRNDAYAFLSATDGLVVTGPTHTNVMDIHIGLVV